MLHFEQSLIPRLFRARQTGSAAFVEHPEQEVFKGMQPYMSRIVPGARIGIAAGSRGIYNYDRIVKAVVDQVKLAGAAPYIIPAMGSHGGATAEGQAEVLAGYGISEQTMGAPVLSSMDTVVLGHTASGAAVYFDSNANNMDGIILVNRIKPHTDFHADIESGVVKQMVVGLGKQMGASSIHRRGVYGLANVVPEAARIILDRKPILMGVAILENMQDKTARIEVLPGEDMLEREPALLDEARALMPSLPCDMLDVLVLQEMGKNISGTGIDPNIVGRYLIRGVADSNPKIYRIVCLDLTEESHHNAIGLGIADIITRRMYAKVDLEPTYINTITSGFLERAFIPVIAENDRHAIETALNCCNRFITPQTARMIMIKNTLELSGMIVSEALLPELEDMPGVEIQSEVTLDWDDDGYLRKLF